ncbi:hypothetical protein BDN70DRAFT_984992 [Pholiota conissans]|uniref:Uncharacterized protein n=1 Tax=Pholiota conissans TaxID=109636 RepID=A0A9P6D0Z4_9AGAR|nr:hypothetical protein BDN70DRAFT_984992 [Pholiota conissans]
MQPQPKLISFHLENEPKEDYEGKEYIYLLPENLFGGHAPHLEVFNAQNVCLPVNFDFSVWKNLTILRLDAQGPAAEVDMLKYTTFHDWLDVLRQLKALERLSLSYIFYSEKENDSCPTFSTIADIHLDYLTSLRVITDLANSEAMFDIFAKLVVPDTCTVNLLVEAYNYDDDELEYNYPYPPFALDRLEVGLVRLFGEPHSDVVDADEDDDPTITVRIKHSPDFSTFLATISHKSNNWFQFQQSGNDMSNMKAFPSPPTSDASPKVPAPDSPFSRILAVLEKLKLLP